MATLKDRLSEEMKAALRAGEKVRLSALRMLATSVKNREVELGRELTDEDFVEVAGREVKRRKEAAEAYERAGRDDLLQREREEQQVLETYLPEQLAREELERLVDEAIAETGASSPKEMGKVIGNVMAQAKGRAEGGTVSALVRERLGAG